MSMFSTIRGVLSSCLLFWEVAGYVCTGIVILGCVGEYVAEFTSIPRSKRERHRIARLSLIILTAGIAGELLTAIRSSQISGKVIADLQTTVREAKGSASDAADAAQRAKAAADGAEKSLTLLRAQVIPRSVFVAEKAGILVNAMKPFAWQKLEIRTNLAGIRDPKEREETSLLESEIRFLVGQVSKWSITEASGDNGWGVSIAVRPNSSGRTREAARALATALGDCGLTDGLQQKPEAVVAEKGTQFERENGPPETIVLWIGEHPEQIVNVRSNTTAKP